MWPTRQIAQAITPKPRAIFHGKPHPQLIAPTAPVALMGRGLPEAESASFRISCLRAA